MDILSNTIVFEDIGSMIKSAEEIIKKDETIRAIDRWKQPSLTGYRDIIINIKMSNGFIGEIRLNVRQMYEAKEIFGGNELFELLLCLQEGIDNYEITNQEATDDYLIIIENLNIFYNKATDLVYAEMEANASSLEITHPSLSLYTDKYGVGDKVLSEFTRNKWRLLAANISKRHLTN
ncbi:MAG: hypothetical protein FWE58_03380 [Methanobrevibacter sp.]|nr:hypothetical protein [Methanobrevibacter sp.]